MTLGSLFDGSGGFPLAGTLVGITPVWSSEIEPYPLRVTAARFPEVEQLGSVTDINGGKVEPVDIITFGSPCQDLSVAGKQLGIHEGHRSNLFFEAVRIIKEMRDAEKRTGRTDVDIRPRFAVWENVPGAFSSNKGADFQAVLEALASVRENGVSIPQPKKWRGAGCVVGDGWSIAWRVYDAQYWGVPQRRKRIYLVADFASERAGEILFEREGVSGDSSEGKAAQEGIAADAERGVGGSDSVKCLNPWDAEGKRIFDVNGCMQTLFAGQGGHLRGVCYAIEGNVVDRESNKNGKGWCENVSPCRKYIVRRLTPTECARLQGFPDWWTDGVEGGDSAQYKMWGNGIALPCAVDVLGRIARDVETTTDGYGEHVSERERILRI